MNLYFFAPWIILGFMIAVVVTTLIIVHCLISLCLIEQSLNKSDVLDSPINKEVKHVSWLKWTRKSKSPPEMSSYVRSSSYCDISVTSASYHPYPWTEPENYQRSVYLGEGDVYGSYDSITTNTTDTDFYRDWRHSIEFTDFTDFYDPKYKDRNQNVIYI